MTVGQLILSFVVFGAIIIGGVYLHHYLRAARPPTPPDDPTS